MALRKKIAKLLPNANRIALLKKRQGLYALTLSPPIRHGDAEYLYDSDRYLIRKILNRCTDHYIVYPEFDKTCRLHYHGILQVKDMIKFHKHTRKALKAHFNFILVEALPSYKDHLQYMLYMRKDWGKVQGLFDRPILPRARRGRRMR